MNRVAEPATTCVCQKWYPKMICHPIIAHLLYPMSVVICLEWLYTGWSHVMEE